MDHPYPLPVVAALIGLGIVIRIIADRLDRDRIREHIKNSGGKVEDISWNPFGRGWFGSRGQRIYEVRYRGRHGKIVEATCKTSMLGGVYWTGDSAPAGFIDSAEGSGAPAEPMQCLACGSTIPGGKSRCPKCGWSYKDAS